MFQPLIEGNVLSFGSKSNAKLGHQEHINPAYGMRTHITQYTVKYLKVNSNKPTYGTKLKGRKNIGKTTTLIYMQ